MATLHNLNSYWMDEHRLLTISFTVKRLSLSYSSRFRPSSSSDRESSYDYYGNRGGNKKMLGEEEDWDYEKTWRDWFYDRRKLFIRTGVIAGGAGVYYVYHLESAPITGRRRFMAMSESQERQLAEQSLEQVAHQFRHAILPSHHPAVRHVERVAQRIIQSLDPKLVPPNTRWRVFVVESSTANAFVLPSGDIFVFTGLLPIAANEDGLAAILGHEIAHKIARHGAEKLSFLQFFNLAFSLLQIFVSGDFGGPFAGLLQNLFLFLPFSRNCESEADYIGLLLMARACYDPQEAIRVWRRMQEGSKGQGSPPAFLSTHPSHAHRIEAIQKWQSDALKEYEQAGCYERRSTASFFRNL